MKKQGVYIFTNLINDKVYIGSSLDLSKRYYEHCRELELGEHCNKHFQNAWNKYGKDNFSYDILEYTEYLEDSEANNKNLRALETKYIQDYKAFNADFGYNIIPGGIGTQGLPCSVDKKKKISDANKGRTAYNKSVQVSEDQKQYLREKAIKERGKSIDIYTTSGKFIETIGAIREVHRKYGVSRNTIVNCCNNLTVPIKYIFRYHGDLLDTVSSKRESVKDLKSEKELLNDAKKYRENRGKKIDIYDSFGSFLETLPAIVEVSEKYNLSQSTIRKGLKEKTISGGFFFRYHKEDLGDISNIVTVYNSKTPRISNLHFLIYIGDSLIEVLKYKKDVEKYAKNREKSKLQRLLTACTKCGDSFNYHEYIIKFNLAPTSSDIGSELRQLNKDDIEGTIIDCANGEA